MARGEKRVRDSRKMSKGEIVCLQETKMEVMRRNRAYGKSVCGLGLSGSRWVL